MAYLIARLSGKARVPSVVFGVTALALGVLVAFVKYTLAAH
ncbi:hypothetical protein [Aquihabitans sp. McL0605]